MSRIIFVVFLFIISGCSTSKTTAKAPSETHIVLDGKLFAAAYQQLAGEYYALCTQAYNVAKLRLDLALANPGSKPPAIVTDVDETVLDNSPNTVHQSLQGKEYDSPEWMEWTAKAKADTVPGALGFLKYAAARNTEVFYITNRDATERDATLRNLQLYGFPFADSAHLLPKTTSSGKEPRRQIVMSNHEIVLFIGDNLTDFSMLFDKQNLENRNAVARTYTADFGNRFIVLPNTTYGDWENAFYQYNYSLTPKQKDSIIIKLLKNY